MSMDEAVAVCHLVQKKLTDISIDAHNTFTMHASFGLAEFIPSIDVQELFLRADAALYEAKETRNNIAVFPNT